MLQEWPDKAVLITNTTPTGSEQTQKLLVTVLNTASFPFDTPLVTGAFLRHWSPQLVVMVETEEIWPNVMASAHEQGIPVALVNARLSARSAQGYARLGDFTRETLKRFQPDCRSIKVRRPTFPPNWC